MINLSLVMNSLVIALAVSSIVLFAAVLMRHYKRTDGGAGK